MDTKRTLSITEARKRIFEIIDEVQKPDIYYTLTEKSKPKAVVLSVEEFESLWETIETLQDMPDLAKDIEEYNRDKLTGADKSYPTLEEVLEKEGFVVADKANKQYDVQHKIQASGKKRKGRAPAKR